MQIESLRVKGIGPFVDEINISANELDEIVAVTGNNGAGKTFLLECIPGALFGYFPFRMFKQQGISIYDMVTPGFESFIEMTFIISGRRYQISRTIEIRGTWKGNDFHETGKTQNVIIQEWVGDEWISRAEKSKAVNEYVEREICTQQLFLASSFNSQNSAGDIVDCGPDERKQIFANIIGLGGLQEKAVLFGARALFINQIINQQETLKASEESRLVDEAELESDIIQNRSTIENYRKERESLDAANQILLEQKARFDTIEADMRKLKNQADNLLLSLSSKESDAEKLGKMIAAKSSIGARMDELKLLRDATEWNEGNREAIDINLSGLRALDDRLAELKLEAQKALTSINGDRARADSDLSTMRRRYEKAQVALTQAQAKEVEASILSELDCPKNCRYVSRALEAEAWLVENPVEVFISVLEKEQKKVDDARNKLAEIDVRIKNKDYEKAFSDEAIMVNEKRREFDSIVEQRDTVENEIKAARSKIKMLEDNQIEQKVAKIQMAEKQLPGLLKEIEEMKIAISESKDEFNKLSFQSSDNPNSKIDDIQRRLKEIESLVELGNRNITECEMKIKNNKQSRMKIRIHEVMIMKYQKLRGNYERLKEAFGRSGIQALVIDSEKHQFLDIARELFSILSGGKMALHFQTQKILKSKAVREDFDLILTVDGVTRKLEQCSQGQQDLGRIVMRATLGIYHSVKSGARIQTYFLDETTGSLDELNRENYYEFLKYLLNYFKQIFVISHQDVARIIPCRIKISNDHKVTV